MNEENLICFDMDGVLIHSMTIANTLFFDAVEEQLQLPTADFRNDKKLMSLSVEERFELLWKKEIDERNISEEAIEETIQIYRKKKLATNIPILPKAKETVELMAKHFKFLAVVSSNITHVIQETVKRLELESYFSHIQGIDDVAFTKPHPEMYQKAAESLGMDPKKALAFEDSTHGIPSAKGAGMTVIGVATGLESVKDLQKTPAEKVIQGFSELNLEMVEHLLS